jgi:peroxiredoxin
MKRQFVSGVIVLASLAFFLTTLSQAADSAAKAQSVQGPAAQQAEAVAEQQFRKLQQQIDDMRAAHQDLINQLTALRATAVKEKATATISSIEKLITKQQTSFQENMRVLQRQQQTLRQTMQKRTGGTDRAVREARRVPQFQLRDFAQSKTVKLSDYRGKIVVIEWIDLDCPFSMYHHKTKNTMVNLANKYKDVVWLAINSTANTTPQANVGFAKEQKLPYPILDDRTGSVGRMFGAQKTPQMFIIDAQQRSIVYEGAIDNAPMGEIGEGQKVVNYVDEALAALTSGKEVPTSMTLPYGSAVKYAAP